MAWNMIDAASPSTRDVVDALRAGRMYGVFRTSKTTSGVQTVLAGFEFSDGTLLVTCAGEPSTFTFVGQDGVIRKTVKDAMSASYTFAGDDTYIRTVIESPRAILYLNPVLRYDGIRLPAPSASVNLAGSWLQRGLLLIAAVALVVMYRRRRAGVLVSPHQAILPRGDRKTA